MYQFDSIKAEYSHLWENCKINPGKLGEFKEQANLILKGKKTYQDLENKTGVPWYFIGMLHLRESDCNFNTHLHNGDSLRARTHDVPAGRPPGGHPPFTFEYSAIDALTYEGFLSVKDWSAERIAYCCEKYNGFGYRMHGMPSAYLWAGTNNYSHGKYVSDNVWSNSAVDTQLGAMGILATLEQLDDTIDVPYDGKVTSTTFKANPVQTDADMTDSRKWNVTDARQKATVVVGAGAAAYKSIDVAHISSLQQFMDVANHFIVTYGIWMLLGGLAAAIAADYILKTYMVQDVKQGRAIMSGTLVNVDTGNPV